MFDRDDPEASECHSGTQNEQTMRDTASLGEIHFAHWTTNRKSLDTPREPRRHKLQDTLGTLG